jgi:REP element-mobilizing transposase RayT
MAQFEGELHRHIKRHLEDDFDCDVRAINGTKNHVHVLFLLSPNYAIKDLLQNMKGESSHWVNQQNLTGAKSAWQTGYSAFSVSEASVPEVQRYIEDQKRHHMNRTFAAECEELLHLHGLSSGSETVETVSTSFARSEAHD